MRSWSISSLFDPVLEQEASRLGAWYLEKVEGVEALEHVISGAVSVSRPRWGPSPGSIRGWI